MGLGALLSRKLAIGLEDMFVAELPAFLLASCSVWGNPQVVQNFIGVICSVPQLPQNMFLPLSVITRIVIRSADRRTASVMPLN